MSSLRNNDVEAEVEFTLKLWKGLGAPVIDVAVKKDSLLVCVLKYFGILVSRCGSVVVRERDKDTKDQGLIDPGLRFSFFLIETLKITGPKFSKCLKNGSDRGRKGQLPQRCFTDVTNRG